MNYQQSVLIVPDATPENYDAAQYMLYKGRKQYNLCGEFCAAYCLQKKLSNNINDFLSYWELKSLKWYQTLFKNGLSRTTGIYDLGNMLSPFGYATPLLPLTKIKILPENFVILLKDFQAIVGVSIDNYGYLVGNGIRHWVVLDDIEYINTNHSIVKIYNPFTNNEEPYTWRELMTSTGAYKQGAWIERNE